MLGLLKPFEQALFKLKTTCKREGVPECKLPVIL